MKHFTTLLAFALISFSWIWAQTWEHFTESNSDIPQDRVSALSFDQDGLLWVGTTSRGLSTFDGTNWSRFDTAALPDICAVGITDISVSPVSNDVWVVAQNSCGILQYERGLSAWVQHGILFNYGPRSVDIDDRGAVWIGNEANGGLFRYDGTDFTNFTENNSDNPNDYVYAVGIIDNDRRWIAGTHGIGLMDDQADWISFDHDDYGPPAFIIFGDVVVQNDSISWFSHRKGLLRYNMNQDSWQSYDETNSPIPLATCRAITNEMVIDKQGNIWMGSCGGLLKFDGTTWTVFNTSNSGIPSNSLTDIAIDDQQNIWIGLLDKGLAVYRPDQATSLEEPLQHEALQVSIYPNPAATVFEVSTVSDEAYQVQVFDLQGRKLIEKSAVNGSVNISTAGLTPGTYGVLVQTNNEAVMKKLLVK
ncbi:MAG: T9SS type A sorting domain-containing protein [Bacteroidia bacterium]